MKKNLFIISILTLLCGFPSLFAQTPDERREIIAKYDLDKLKQIEILALADYERNREEALALAPIYGWEESYETENGGFALLIGVTDGQYPIYYKTTNEGAAITARVDRINTGGGAGLNLNGENMLVGVWDGGKVRDTHESLVGRTNQMDGATSLSNHATHVTGTILASAGFNNGSTKGMAPLAEALTYDFANPANELVNAITTHGLLISNHSYGVPADTQPTHYLGKYVTQARQWDQIHFNAPYHLAVMAAGNDRNTNHDNQGDGGYDLLTGNSNSKNNLVVAATQQVLNYTGPSGVTMSDFSSWGPTDDGRIKPDISAKGVNTFSLSSDSNSSYGSSSGTSMAAPSVAGALALLQQHYNNLNATFMRSATLRGLVIHTADEAGTTPGPDYRFGWGLINAERAAKLISNNASASIIAEEVLMNGAQRTVSGTAIPGEPIIVSLTWTDKEGVAITNTIVDDNTPALVNDLDLRLVDANSTQHMPWILNPNFMQGGASKGDNFRDNVEKIEINEPSGNYTINITHKGTLDGGQQAYSLIISGMQNVVLNTTDINEVIASVYPNPATDKLNIQSKNQISNVEIINVLGQTVGEYEVNSLSTQLDIANLRSGTYFVKVTIDTQSKVYKVVKK